MKQYFAFATKMFAIACAILGLWLGYAGIGVRGLFWVGFLAGLGVTCIWFPGPMGGILGMARYTGVQMFQVPEILTKIVGWILLLLPIFCWALFKWNSGGF